MSWKCATFARKMKSGIIKYLINLFLTLALLLMPVLHLRAEMTLDHLAGEDKVMFDKFRDLFQNGEPGEFYSFTNEYAKQLKEKNYMMLYYKLKSNQGFFALRHNMVYRAMQYAKELNEEIRKDGAKQYAYLATGLMGDIFNTCNNYIKAEQCFLQALEEVGDTDPKFVMRTYMNISEMLSLKDQDKAVAWMEKSIALSKQIRNVEYYSLSLAMKGYVLFLKGDAKGFNEVYGQYDSFRKKGYQGFSPRYENIMEVARLSFEKQYDKALDKVHEGHLAVDSSLVVVHIYSMAGDAKNFFEAIKRRSYEKDSIYSLMQDMNFNQLAAESAILRSKEEALISQQKVKRLTNWIIGLCVAFFIIYIMGRRRLMKKISDKNKRLKKALERAEESDRMKIAFIRSMSHEIRTPLNAVSGFSQLLCNPDFSLSDEEKMDMQKRISTNVDLVTNIVNEVLELSKTESESVFAEIEKTNLACNAFCREVLNAARGVEKDGVEIRYSSNVGDDFFFLSNSYRLKKALNYLIDNAQKFTEKGSIELSCQHIGEWMEFSVTDTGIGIREKDRERVFEIFAKVDDFKEGLGLGLPICRRMVQSLGGTLTLDPDYNHGCRFVIKLPMK